MHWAQDDSGDSVGDQHQWAICRGMVCCEEARGVIWDEEDGWTLMPVIYRNSQQQALMTNDKMYLVFNLHLQMDFPRLCLKLVPFRALNIVDTWNDFLDNKIVERKFNA